MRCGQPAIGSGAGTTPLGDHFVAADQLDQVQEAYPLDLMLCPGCGNVQLRHVVNPEVIYRQYKYTSSVSLGLVEHFRRYADAVMRQNNLPRRHPGGGNRQQ